MALYHFSAKMISRANGSSALAAAAYRSASRLHDQRLDRAHDFTNKAGVVHSEVLLPDGAPEEWRDRAKLWNDVEAAEVRKDAQLAREIEFALPRELDQQLGIDLARNFVKREFVNRGMVADLNVHWDPSTTLGGAVGADGEPKPHAHVMLTTRSIGEDGFGAKVRDWNRTDLLEHWREAWAEHLNRALAERDIDARVDHRSLQAQGIALEPQHKIGPAAARMAGEGLALERVDEHRAIARLNGAKLLLEPTIALDAITHSQATFTTRDLAMFVHRHSDGKEQFDRVMAAVKSAPELVALGKDGRGQERFTSRAMLETEKRLALAADMLASRRSHGLAVAVPHAGSTSATARGRITLGEQQEAALRHIISGRDLSLVVGYAGTGKSAMLGIAREQWERAGYTVQGAALSGIAAENLGSGSGIASRTIASLEHQWKEGRDLLTDAHVLVIDEAGMIGTRQMERVLTEAQQRGAKVVLVGDPQQLQAIEAGAAFRSLAERHGAIEITTVRRQREDWQRDATRHLATERTGEALAAYSNHGHVHADATREDARDALIDRWARDRADSPDASRIILTHTNDDVLALNRAARARLMQAGALGEEITLKVERGDRMFAAGDRIMFLKNERSLDVKNGSLGTVQSVSTARMAVMLDDGRSVGFDLKDYAAIDHGYAATIHKAQGMTVDRVHVLATPGLDAHATYVALSRHRDRVDLHYGQDDFADPDKLARTLSRERGKDMASDYAPIPQPQVTPPPRSIFAGLKLRPSIEPAAPEVTPFDKAVQRFGRAAQDIVRMGTEGLAPLPHQRVAFQQAANDLNALRPGGARDLRDAFHREPGLIDDAVQGRTATVVRAMMLEADLRAQAAIRAEQALRADRFVTDWQRQARLYERHIHEGESAAADRIRQGMIGMAKSLERDPQLESLLRERVKTLGIRPSQGGSISHDLQIWSGFSRGRGIER
jgi:Ti-type conjugative transfer relaxase TraA